MTWRYRFLGVIIGLFFVQAEKVVRLTDNTGGDNQWNRTECWLLRLLLEDGESPALCETTEQSVIDEMASFLSGMIEKNNPSENTNRHAAADG